MVTESQFTESAAKLKCLRCRVGEVQSNHLRVEQTLHANSVCVRPYAKPEITLPDHSGRVCLCSTLSKTSGVMPSDQEQLHVCLIAEYPTIQSGSPATLGGGWSPLRFTPQINLLNQVKVARTHDDLDSPAIDHFNNCKLHVINPR